MRSRFRSASSVRYGRAMQSRLAAFVVIAAALLGVDPRVVRAGGA
jgi:hypothetical protein